MRYSNGGYLMANLNFDEYLYSEEYQPTCEQEVYNCYSVLQRFSKHPELPPSTS